jgi:hypothetical protein
VLKIRLFPNYAGLHIVLISCGLARFRVGEYESGQQSTKFGLSIAILQAHGQNLYRTSGFQVAASNLSRMG